MAHPLISTSTVRKVVNPMTGDRVYLIIVGGPLILRLMKKVSELNLFRAFRSRNYSLYFVGRAVSQFGTWMQRTAVIWLVYSITQSTFLIGMTIFAEIFPSFLFSVAGGVAADRYDRYQVLRITQVTSMIQSVLLAALLSAQRGELWGGDRFPAVDETAAVSAKEKKGATCL
jgi:hypothetical protein